MNNTTIERRFVLRLFGRGTLAALTAPLLAACAIAQATERLSVEMTEDNRFAPSSLTIARGTIVVWKNQSTHRHTASCTTAQMPQGVTITLPPAAQPWDSGDVYPGAMWLYTFDTPGQYLYACRYHGAEGMIGSIRVTE